jgi:hypothetical protein
MMHSKASCPAAEVAPDTASFSESPESCELPETTARRTDTTASATASRMIIQFLDFIMIMILLLS